MSNRPLPPSDRSANARADALRVQTISLAILAAVAVGFVLWFTRSVLVPFVLALFIVTAVSPLAKKMKFGWGWPSWAALVATYVVVLVVIVLAALLLVNAGRQLVFSVLEYTTRWGAGLVLVVPDADAEPLTEPWEEPADPPVEPDSGPPVDASGSPGVGVSPVADEPVAADPAVAPADLEEGDRVRGPPWRTMMTTGLQETLDAWGFGDDQTVQGLRREVTGLMRAGFGTAISILTGLILTALFTIFLLAGRLQVDEGYGLFNTIEAKVRSYILRKTGISLVTGVLVWLTLSLLGLPNALSFGVIAFVLNYIPSVGSIIATLMPLPTALNAFGDSTAMIVAVVAIPGVIQFSIGNFVEPLLFSEDLDLHPATVLISLVVWAMVWGPVGAIMAVPITAAIRITMSQFVTLRPAAEMLAGRFDAAEAAAARAAAQSEAEPRAPT